jgi:pyruvate ferredoxin oxidoreductase gamma subunit
VIEIRFHGRGGQGAKLASRIVGRAGFLAGLFAQDFPLFGAERQGAPVVATTRLSLKPIERRGFAHEPDALVILDATLLREPQGQILTGVRPGIPVLLNGDGAESFVATLALPVIFIPATTIARRVTGQPIVSAVMAGATSRFVPEITADVLAEAISTELKALSLDPNVVSKNIAAAQFAYTVVPSFYLSERKTRRPARLLADAPRFPFFPTEQVGAGIQRAGNAELRHTGTWRTERPVIDQGKCKRCFLCYLDCPDGAIHLDEGNFPHIDYEFCKGCLICYEECPPRAISFKLEEHEHGA